ncbi:MAB_1171c family putative transporter [Allostreptomyces psammosilenae]|uniref:DUF6545 domain-containing protein n=1 Tax=Allostreptomyces psammosilenae TaxID=1892865 RepID=A0A852ZYH1_9ACTN|nr:MAB_1171c family putative transporter [Allostreptomyces psammosilenae]NYI06857.1 hypothetical protein [Allostreptomyces psammosilenae]
MSDPVAFNAVYLTCGLGAYLLLAFKVRAVWRAPSPSLYTLTSCLAFPATAFVVAAPAVYTTVDRLTGVPNLATLLVYCLITGFSASGTVQTLLWTRPDPDRAWDLSRRSVRWVLLLAVIVVAMMITLFLTADLSRVDSAEHPLDFDTTYAEIPSVTVFLLLYQAFFALSLLSIGVVCFRYARTLRQPWFKRGVCAVAVGSWIALGYGACKVAAILACANGAHGPTWELLSTSVAPVFAAAGAALITIGMGTPSAAAWATHAREFRALQPLWTAVRSAAPSVVLDSGAVTTGHGLRALLAVRDLEWRLARRVVEIRDGQLQLRGWYDVDTIEAARRGALAAHATPAEVDAVVEAAALASAVRARRAGLPLHPHEVAEVGLAEAGADLRQELEHLVRVARAWNGPVVAAALAETAAAVEGPARAHAGSVPAGDEA